MHLGALGQTINSISPYYLSSTVKKNSFQTSNLHEKTNKTKQKKQKQNKNKNKNKNI